MFVLTADQHGSRTGIDLVPQVLERLKALNTKDIHEPKVQNTDQALTGENTRPEPGFVLPFERTVGDEIQAITDDPTTVLAVASLLLRSEDWSLGIGVGVVQEPLPGSTREARGPAFIAARAAVEQAKREQFSIAVQAADPEMKQPADDVSALLRLLATVWQRRSDHGWEAVEAVAGFDLAELIATQKPMRSGKEASEILDISPQALSQRLRAGLWQVELDILPLAARLLANLQAKA